MCAKGGEEIIKHSGRWPNTFDVVENLVEQGGKG